MRQMSMFDQLLAVQLLHFDHLRYLSMVSCHLTTRDAISPSIGNLEL